MYGIESGWFRQKIKTKFKNWARSLHFSAMTSITQEPRLMRVSLSSTAAAAVDQSTMAQLVAQLHM